jgi:hypothetical protein
MNEVCPDAGPVTIGGVMVSQIQSSVTRGKPCAVSGLGKNEKSLLVRKSDQTKGVMR